jgi:hypothetical protein
VHVRNVIGVHTFSKKLIGKETHDIGQLHETVFGSGLVTAPFPDMFFRPEEVHGASGKRKVTKPFSKGDGRIGDDPFRLLPNYLTVLHFQ